MNEDLVGIVVLLFVVLALAVCCERERNYD